MPPEIRRFVNRPDRAPGIREVAGAENPHMERTPGRLDRLIRAANPLRLALPSAASRVAARVSERLEAGDSLGTALRGAAELLSAEAVRDATGRFDGGAAALFIADVRDALVRTLDSTGRKLSRRHPGAGAYLGKHLSAVARALADEQVEQHLINCVLGVAGLHAEAAVLEPTRVDPKRLQRSLAEWLRQLIGSTLSGHAQGQTLDSLGAGYDLPPLLNA